MGQYVTQAIVDAACPVPGCRVLDIASGAGEPAISIATLLQGSGEVIGIDISPGPLEIAAARAAARNLANVKFQQADAHQIPFPDASFDLITSRLGVMFFADLPRALAEMRRVLKPEGRVVLLAWGRKEQPFFESTVGTVLRVCPELAFPDSARGMFAFGRPGVLAEALRKAGFKSVEEDFHELPWPWPGKPEEAWEYFQEVAVPFSPLFQAIPRDRRAQVDAEVVRAIARYYDGHEVKFTAAVNISSAAK